MSNENFNVPSKSKSKSRPSPVQYLSNVLSKYPILYIYIFGHCPRYNKFIVQVPSRPVQVPSKSNSKSNPNTARRYVEFCQLINVCNVTVLFNFSNFIEILDIVDISELREKYGNIQLPKNFN